MQIWLRAELEALGTLKRVFSDGCIQVKLAWNKTAVKYIIRLCLNLLLLGYQKL